MSGLLFVFEGVCGEPCEVVLECGLGEAVFGCLGGVVFGGVGEDAAQVGEVVAEGGLRVVDCGVSHCFSGLSLWYIEQWVINFVLP